MVPRAQLTTDVGIDPPLRVRRRQTIDRSTSKGQESDLHIDMQPKIQIHCTV